MASSHQMSEEWKQLVSKLEHKIISEENIAFMQKEESAMKLRTKEKECESLRDHMKSVIDINRRLTNQLEIAVEKKKKLNQQLIAAQDIIARLKSDHTVGLKSKHKVKRVDKTARKLSTESQHSSNISPLNVFANHSDSSAHNTSKVYAITVQNPSTDRSHTFYQFSPDSTAHKLYKAVSDHYRVSDFELACLTYKKLENSTDSTLQQNGVYDGIHLFVIDSNKAPKSRQLFHVMLGNVISNSDTVSNNKDTKQIIEDRDYRKSQNNSDHHISYNEVALKSEVNIKRDNESENKRKIFSADNNDTVKHTFKDRMDSELYNKLKREKAIRKLRKVQAYKRFVSKYWTQPRKPNKLSYGHDMRRSVNSHSSERHSSSSRVIDDHKPRDEKSRHDSKCDKHSDHREYRNVGHDYKSSKQK